MLLIASLIMWTSVFNSAMAHNGTTRASSYLEMDAKIISDLEAYVERQESILQMMRKKLLTFRVEHTEALRDGGDKYFANEVNKFRLIKRLASDIHSMAARTAEAANKFKSLISYYRDERLLPSEDDLRKSSLEIAQMRESVHKLRTDKIVRGFFGAGEQRRARASLSTEDCFQIGKQLNSAKMYREAIGWLKEALKHYNEYYDLHRVNDIEILEELAISLAFDNQERLANDVIGKILRMDSSNQIASQIRHSREAMERSRSAESAISDLCRPSEELLSFLTFTCPTYSGSLLNA